MKTVKTCTTRFEAEMVKGNLENQGFHPVVFDFSMDMVLPNASLIDESSSLKVAVPDPEYDQVMDYLKNGQNADDLQEEN